MQLDNAVLGNVHVDIPAFSVSRGGAAIIPSSPPGETRLMITVMMMSVTVAVFVAFGFVPVALLLIFPHFNKTHRLTTGAVVVAITAPVALMGVRCFHYQNAVVVRIGISDPHMAMHAWQYLTIQVDFNIRGLGASSPAKGGEQNGLQSNRFKHSASEVTSAVADAANMAF
jgi:hypothetical protein